MVMLIMSYVGLAVGANKRPVNLAALAVSLGEKTGKKSYKISTPV